MPSKLAQRGVKREVRVGGALPYFRNSVFAARELDRRVCVVLIHVFQYSCCSLHGEKRDEPMRVLPRLKATSPSSLAQTTMVA